MLGDMSNPQPGPVTAARFAWTMIGAPPHEPPEPKRGRPRYGESALCWLCGGDTEGRGWLRRAAIPPTFTNHNLAACPTSDAVCEPCAYFAFGDGWRAYCASRPELGLKDAHPLSWRSYSHVFAPSEPGGHRCPSRREWRALLLEPPPPPFVLTIAESGQKHIVFRGRPAYGRDLYPVQVEEDTLFVLRHRLAACIALFEEMLAMGFTRDEIASGQYSSHRTLPLGAARFAEIDERMEGWRTRLPQYVRLAHFAAHRPQAAAAEEPDDVQQPDAEEPAAESAESAA